jgi:hypothetical protein
MCFLFDKCKLIIYVCAIDYMIVVDFSCVFKISFEVIRRITPNVHLITVAIL